MCHAGPMEMQWGRHARIKPRNEVPTLVPSEHVIARTDEVAVRIAAPRVYSSGVELRFEAWVRRPSDVRTNLHGGPRPDGKQFLLGVEFADGRTATNQQRRQFDLSEDQPALMPGSGSSGNGTSSAQFYLTPLPPNGPLALVVAWPAFGITETRIELDGSAIRDAAQRVLTLWPDAHEEKPVTEPPKPPEYEPGGWFDTNRALEF